MIPLERTFHCESVHTPQTSRRTAILSVKLILLSTLLQSKVLSAVDMAVAEKDPPKFYNPFKSQDGYELLLPKYWVVATKNPTGLSLLCRDPDIEDENVTAAIASLPERVNDLYDLGDPSSLGKRLIELYDRPGTDRSAQLIFAKRIKRQLDEKSGVATAETFEFEYTVKSKDWERHYLSKVAINSADKKLITLTVCCPEDRFTLEEKLLRGIADSFKVFD